MNISQFVRAVAFWVAALLPIVYLPVLLAGIDSPTRLSVLVGLLALNAVALVVGHDHRQPTRHHGG